jgi:hypothetical protein
MRPLPLLALAALALTVALTSAAPKPAEPPAKGKVEPAGAPLEARLIAKKTMYVLDRKGKSADDYAKDAEKNPPPVDVDLVLELRNTSAKDIKIWVLGQLRGEQRLFGGDYVEFVLDLKGPGAVRALVARRYTRPRTPGPNVTTIGPGKTVRMPLTSLWYGRPGVATYEVYRTCWTKAGDYTLTATYKTAVDPAPAGSKPARWGTFDGGHVAVTSAPIKLKVVEAKKGKP